MEKRCTQWRMYMKRTVHLLLGLLLLVQAISLADYVYGDSGRQGGGSYQGGGSRQGGGGSHGGGHYYGGGTYHHGGHGGHWSGGVWIGPGWGWPGWGWGWGPWWGAPYYPYYSAPPVVVEQQPPVYIEPEPQVENYWYYCRNPRGYYPYVNQCPSGWMKVLPSPVPPDVKE